MDVPQFRGYDFCPMSRADPFLHSHTNKSQSQKRPSVYPYPKLPLGEMGKDMKNTK